ncbi:MAG: hypothetical protein IIC50_03635 [Planctomycetes bacterium]|nr:hypothetical protein [Planctomycetota bacterium]
MLKRVLIATAVLAIALPAAGGDVKVHEPWPTMYVAVPVTTILVCLDLGFYIHIKDQKCIKVVQDASADNPYKTYSGCVTSAVESNFDATITASIKDTSPAKGKWKVQLNGGDHVHVPEGFSEVEICVTGEDVEIGKLHGGDADVPVADVTIKLVLQ